MTTHTETDPSMQRWGHRSAWVSKAWPRDTQHLSRWFVLTSYAKLGSSEVKLFTRVLAWDSSAPPKWVDNAACQRVRVECRETKISSPESLFSAEELRDFRQGKREARRLQLPVNDWYSGYDARAWRLQTPLTLYELWATRIQHTAGGEVWSELEREERRTVGIPQEDGGLVCSCAVLIPKVQTFFHGPHRLVVSGDEAQSRRCVLVSEVRDGPMTLARDSTPLAPEPWPNDHSSKNLPLNYVRLYFREANLESLSQDLPEHSPAVFQFSRARHGLSGSDWTVSVIAPNGEVDACRTGLIRGFGQGYLTSEPWRARAATLGFSAPARVVHIPPTDEGAETAYSELQKLGPGTVCIADPYADAEQLERLDNLLPGARLITSKKATGLSPEWLSSKQIEARKLNSLHDRFVLGSRRAALVGSSLNGLGKNHSFIVLIDAVMQSKLQEAFEQLWRSAHPYMS